MNYKEEKAFTAKVKNLLTKKTMFFDVFAPSIMSAIATAEELGVTAFGTNSVEVIACGINSLPVPDKKIS